MLTLLARKRFWVAQLYLALSPVFFSGNTFAKDNWIEVKSPHFTVLSNAGEGQSRRLADQFEEFREMFHSTFPAFRLDLGKPLLIFAVKNEDGMKLLLPGYWEVKGHVHPWGIFVPGEAADFVAARTDVQTENPYHVIYHEYTHAIMDLNFQGLPIWLGEGLAEFFGNSTILDKEVKIGKIAEEHLQTLQTNRLIPIDVLLQADAQSPYYNEENRAGVFYAESWAIVHYLLLDPEAHKRQLMTTFLKTWDASGNQLEAAQKAFGDLKKFGSAMEAYARQQTFYISEVHTTVHGDAKSYLARPLSPAEVAANTSLFLSHMQRFKEAQSQADDALHADPNLAMAHEASGTLCYFQQNFPAAEKELTRSTELSPTSPSAYYYLALSQMRQGAMEPEQMSLITSSLEKTIQLNPQFAPAYATLSNFYSMRPETRDKAFDAGKKAIELEPGNIHYAMNLGYTLVNLGKTSEAKLLAERILKAAKTPQEIQMADSLRQAADSRASMGQYVEVRPNSNATSDSSSASTKSTEITIADSSPSTPPETPAAPASAPPPVSAPMHIASEPSYRLEGKVTAADCKPAGEIIVTLSINTVLMKFHAADWKKVEVTPDAKAFSTASPSCASWKAQRAEVVFRGNPAGEFDGELVGIHFR